MESKYLAIAGNEYGLSPSNMHEKKFMTYEEAKTEYDSFFEDDGPGAGVLMEFNMENNCMRILESNCIL